MTPGGTSRRADGAEQDGIEAAQLLERRVGQDLAVAEVALAAEVELDGVESTPAAPRTLSASAVTSGPIPSPPITAMRCGPLLVLVPHRSPNLSSRRR